VADVLVGAAPDDLALGPVVLRDGLQVGNPPAIQAVEKISMTTLTLGLRTGFAFLGTLILMLPVTWVYMSTAPGRKYNQSLVQALMVLPMVVAGIVVVVQNSLALAFSLAGVVAAVRFRTTLTEARDTVFVFLSIAVGFAAGVQMLMPAVYLSVLFNFVLLFIWRSNFGRVLEPTAMAEWGAPLSAIAAEGDEAVPDRDLILALTPKKAALLSNRFDRVRKTLGSNAKQPRYNAVVTIRATDIDEAQRAAEKALEDGTKRWRLDETVTNVGKPSELFYLVRTRKSIPANMLVTEIRRLAGVHIVAAEVEVADAVTVEAAEQKERRKREQALAVEGE